jgi:hypothetical protein
MAVANTAQSDDAAASAMAAVQEQPVAVKVSMTKLAPFAVANATIATNPVASDLLASQVNRNLEDSLLSNPQEGFIKTVFGAGAGDTTLTVDGYEYGAAPGADTSLYSAALLRLNISTSSLNARQGAPIQIRLEFTTPAGQDLVTGTYAILRASSDKPILGIFIPYTVIAGRVLPLLASYGKEGATTRTLKVIATGLSPDEQLSVTIPGYTTGEMRRIAEAYNLPAGLID